MPSQFGGEIYKSAVTVQQPGLDCACHRLAVIHTGTYVLQQSPRRSVSVTPVLLSAAAQNTAVFGTAECVALYNRHTTHQTAY